MTPYQPDRGDFVWIDFSPHAGIEQAGRRPGLVVSGVAFNVATGLAFICPVTNQVKGGRFEVQIPSGSVVTGVVLADHARSFDWVARNMEFREKAAAAVVEEVIALITAIVNG